MNPSSVRSSTLRRWVKRSGGGFKRLSIVRLAGLLLVVYVSNRLSQQAIISDIAVQSVPTGMFNLMVCSYSYLDFLSSRLSHCKQHSILVLELPTSRLCDASIFLPVSAGHNHVTWFYQILPLKQFVSAFPRLEIIVLFRFSNSRPTLTSHLKPLSC